MFKKILKWTGIVLGGLIAVLLIANAVFVWRSRVALERRLQAIRDAGEPIAIADLARRPIPPEDNAATYLERARQDFVAIEKALAALSERESYQRGQLDTAEITTLEEVLDAHADAVRLAEQAAACPHYDPQLDYSLSASKFTAAWIEHATPIRSAVRLLNQRTMILLAQGKCDEAAGCARAMLRLARHADQQPVLVGYLVAWMS